MIRIFVWTLIPIVTALLSSCQNESLTETKTEFESQTVDNEGQPTQSILEIMVEEITPATNVLWGVDNPQTDDDWLVLENAANLTIEAATKTALGGSGPLDSEWIQNPAYQAMNGLMLDAAKASLAAVKAQDLDALYTAGDQLYSPCESCHLQFNPAVINSSENF